MIAISYRREDSLAIAGRLYDRLQAKFGKRNVFMDFDSIPPGVDFRDQIKQIIERSKLVIAMIGPNWLGEQSDTCRRIDDPMDFVRLEIAYALKRGIPVIPVLINNAPMPKPEKLPPDIEGLAFRNAVVLDTGIDFHHHADRLIAGIGGLVNVSDAPGDLVADSEKTRSVRSASRQAQVDGIRQRKIVIWGAAIVLVGVVASATWFFSKGERDRAGGASKQLAGPSPSISATVEPAVGNVSPATQSPSSDLAIAEPKASATIGPTTEQSSSSPANARRWQERISEFVRHYVELNESPDVDAAASFYAPDADILEEGPKSLDSVRRDIQAYNERWPMRRSNIRGDIQLREEIPAKEYTASFQQDYYVENLARREWIKGAVAVDLRIVIKDGSPKISSLKQKVLSREKGSLPVGPTSALQPPQTSAPSQATESWESASQKVNCTRKKQKLVRVYVKRVGFHMLLPIEIFPDAATLTQNDGQGYPMFALLDPHASIHFTITPETLAQAHDRLSGDKGWNGEVVYYKTLNESSFTVWRQGIFVSGVKKDGKVFLMNVWYHDPICPFGPETLKAMATSFIAAK